MLAEIILMGIVRGGLGGDKGKTPIRDESLNNPAPIISDLEEESQNHGIVVSMVVLRLEVQKSNWSTVTIFPWWGKEMVRNTTDSTTFMAYVQFLPSRRLYSRG